jgi:DNA-binding response OmpR family regulator
MRVLVIDDYQSHGESLAEFLQTRGHEALYASGYADAEWLLGLFRFDLAILDFDMPGMSGPAMAAKLAERSPNLRCVIVSAHTPAGKRRAELGDLPFIKKPVAPRELLEFLEALDRERVGYSVVLRSTYSIVKYGKP